MKKNNTMYGVIAVLIYTILYYSFLKATINFYVSVAFGIHMTLYVIFSFYIYVLIRFILERSVTTSDKNSFKLLYIIMLVILFFSKDNPGYGVKKVNFDITWARNEMTTLYNFNMMFFNVVLVIPLGWMFRKVPIMYKVFLPLIIFSLVEYTQYVNKVGIFDVVDICLNTLGFYIGGFGYTLLVKIFGEKRIK